MSTIVTRAGKGSALTWAEADANFTNLNTDKAELASPTFTGVPSADTAVSGTNTTQLATTAFVQGKTAAQTPFTATGNIVATNVQAAIAEVDTEKVAKSGDTMTGTLRTPTSQIGTSATTTENHFWDGSVANQLTLRKGTPDAPGAEIMKFIPNGMVELQGLAQSVSIPIGFFTLPNGWIVQYGTANVPSGGLAIGFPKVFPNFVMGLVSTCYGGNSAYSTHQLLTTSGAYLQAWNNSGSTTNDVTWIAIGI